MMSGLSKSGRRSSTSRRTRFSQDKGASYGTVSRKSPGRLGRIFGFVSLRGIFLFIVATVAVAAVIAGTFTISFWLYSKAITSEFFTTRHIDVAGNVRLSRELVLQYGGISEGDNSLAVSISDVERNLRDTPWVEEVSVKRMLPDRFVIKIRERMPSFWVRKDGTLYYANEKGVPIAPVESRNFLSLPTLQIMPGAENDAQYLGELLKDLKNGALPLETGSIASVTLSPSQGIEIYLEDREMRLSIATDDLAGNLTRLGNALTDLARRRELGSVREARAVDGHVWIIRSKSGKA